MTRPSVKALIKVNSEGLTPLAVLGLQVLEFAEVRKQFFVAQAPGYEDGAAAPSDTAS